MAAPLMFAGARAAVKQLLARMGAQGLQAPISRGLAAIKPTGTFDALMTYGPDLAFTGFTLSQLPEGTSPGEAALAAGENLLMNTAIGSVGGRFLGGALANPVVRRLGRRTPRTREFDDDVLKFRTAAEMGIGLGAGFMPLPYTNSLYQRAFERAQGDPAAMEARRQEMEQQQQVQALAALANAGAAGVGGFYGAAASDPFGLEPLVRLG